MGGKKFAVVVGQNGWGGKEMNPNLDEEFEQHGVGIIIQTRRTNLARQSTKIL